MRRTLSSIIAMVAAVLLAAAALAATVCPLPLKALVATADRVAELEVTATQVQMHQGQTFTLADCTVHQTFKGPKEKTLRLRVPGGMAGGFTMIVPGVPTLHKGDRFIAFMNNDDTPGMQPAALRPVGLGQGLYALVKKNGRTYAVQSMGQAPNAFLSCEQEPDRCLRELGVPAVEKSRFIADLNAVLTGGGVQ